MLRRYPCCPAFASFLSSVKLVISTCLVLAVVATAQDRAPYVEAAQSDALLESADAILVDMQVSSEGVAPAEHLVMARELTAADEINCTLFGNNEAACPLSRCFWSISSNSCRDPLPGCPDKPNISQCCANMMDEAEDACHEYDIFGTGAANCRYWRRVAQSSCMEFCGNCTRVAQDIKDLACTFGLLSLNLNQVIIADFCELTEQAFRNFRCPSACFVVDHPEFCDSSQARACMEDCGNYAPCRCREPKGTAIGEPTECIGETIMEGEPHRNIPGLSYSCDIVPEDCYYHVAEGAQCALFRHCETDHCIVKDVTCERTMEDDLNERECIDLGYCETTSGNCFFEQRPRGWPCEDGFPYTVNDTCYFGVCSGIVNYCLRDQVVCLPFDSCTTGGICDNSTGRCEYTKLADGIECDDGRADTVEDRCSNGLCVGRPVDLCLEWGVECTSPSACHDAGMCDSRTGQCTEATPVSGRGCDDGDARTENDTCIDGVCIGDIPGGGANAKFLTRGAGECRDRDMRWMARYSGDVVEERDCQAQCRDDFQCAGYYFSHPSCSIYGTIRTQPPGGRQWSFEAASDPPAIIIEASAPVLASQRRGVCRSKGLVGDEEKDARGLRWDRDTIFHPAVMVLAFTGMLGLFFARPVYRCVQTLRSPLPEDFSPPEPDNVVMGADVKVTAIEVFTVPDEGAEDTTLRLAASPDTADEAPGVVEAESPRGPATVVSEEMVPADDVASNEKTLEVVTPNGHPVLQAKLTPPGLVEESEAEAPPAETSPADTSAAAEVQRPASQ
mmetsp:Transcript_11173/g.20318  ORF Transcript_11173/g.20318 Transcript_11173/m.20318 type:complete len:788 (+) Transcript_11173:76-2439(+)